MKILVDKYYKGLDYANRVLNSILNAGALVMDSKNSNTKLQIFHNNEGVSIRLCHTYEKEDYV